jgi:hypothetical protein
MRRAAVLSLLLAILLVACGRHHNSASSTTTTSSSSDTTDSTHPPGTGLPGVPAVDRQATGTTIPTTCLTVPSTDQATATPPAGIPPFPATTRWISSTKTQDGQTLVVAAVPEALNVFQRRIRTTWFPAGWRELAGESEPGREIEGVLQKANTRMGVRARVAYCDKGWVEVRFVVNG